jgi:beta-glucosidase-like glycosyl hydrolase
MRRSRVLLGAAVAALPAAPVAGAATWDTALMNQYGQVVGNEEWGKGANVSLGPTINIVRDPRWGRAFESYGEDPYLSGQIAAADIRGLQSQGPIDQVKHYAVYNQETYRNTASDDAIVSERAEQKIYLPAFQAAVQQGGAWSVMCSYAEINGTFACENPDLLSSELDGTLGFQGFVTSDWGATHSTVASANAGLDMEMNSTDYFGQPLTDAVGSGEVSQTTIENAARRILTAMFAQGLFDTTQTGSIGDIVTTAAHQQIAEQVAEEGSVLLQNNGSVLPVTSADSSIAVIGDDAGPDALTDGSGSAGVVPSSVVTPFQGIQARAGSGVDVTYSQGVANPNGSIVDSSYLTPAQGSGNGLYAQYYNGNSLSGSAIATGTVPDLDYTWGGQSPTSGVPEDNWSASYTGTLDPPTTGSYTFSLTSDDGSRLFVNGQEVVDNWADQPPTTKTGTSSLTASPTSPTFAGQTVGTTSDAQTVSITNSGSSAVSVSGVTTSGDFAQTNTCGSSLAAGASCTASVTYTPTTIGAETGSLTVTSNATNSVLTVGLSGTGVAAAGTNLALGAMMTASGYTQSYVPSDANDDNTGTYWESIDNAFPQWLQADLGSTQSLGSITLTLPPSTSWATRTQTLSVLGSTDGTDFTTLVGSAGYTFNPSTGNTVTIPLPASTSERYLRLQFTANTGWPAGQISEFEIYSS